MAAFEAKFSNQGVRLTANLSNQGARKKIKDTEIYSVYKSVNRCYVVFHESHDLSVCI